MKRVTIIDVAREVGVSRQTVSRAINDKAEISAKTRQRVLEAVKELGYRPNRLARSMVTRRTHTIGLLIGDITNPFFAEVARGVQDVAQANDYNVFLCNTDSKSDLEMQTLYSLASQPVDGIILFSHAASLQALKAFADGYRPMVLINRALEHPHISTVLVDNFRGGQLAVQYLASQGHTKIGMLANSNSVLKNVLRVTAYRQTLVSLGLPIREEWIVNTPLTLEDGYEATGRFLTEHPEITALFTYNDVLALGAIRACHQLGRHVPDDCAIIGFDDINLAKMMTPSLSTIRVDKYQIGQQAMRRLLAMIEQPEADFPPLELGVELVLREST